MNNTFSFKRFGTYFVSDLRNTFNNTWLTVLITSLAGLIAYVFCGVMNLIISGEWASYELPGRLISFIILFYILIIIVPSKAYGFFTDKRRGSFYTLIPASSLEKTLAMLINVAVLAPLAYIAIALAADALLCLVDPGCGQSLAAAIFSGASELSEGLEELNSNARFTVLSMGELTLGIFLNILGWTLSFLLGALYFKKNKIGKTLLVIIAVSMVLSMFSSPILMNAGEGFIEMIDATADAQRSMNLLKWGSFALSAVVNLGLIIWTYLRVRTVKH